MDLSMDLSEFVRCAAHYYAKKVHEEHQNVTLSLEAGLAFLNALENPPEPSKRLKEAMRRHSKNVKKRKFSQKDNKDSKKQPARKRG